MRLVDPHVRYHRSYLAALDEALAVGEGSDGFLPCWPAEGRFPGVDLTGEAIRDPDAFAELVRFLLRQRRPDEPRPRAYVAATELWMDEGGQYVGRVSVRHELNELLHEWGGHIGYAVRPSARRRGHATAALLDVLELCAERGIDPVLVTCDVDNEASRRVIERAGGQYEDTRQGKLRYWVSVA